MRYFVRPDLYLRTAAHPKIAVREHRLTGIPNAPRGFTMLFASDFHLRPEMDAGAITALLKAQKADVILLGGDFSDTKAQTARLFDAFRSLSARCGIYAVYGNNDAEVFSDTRSFERAVKSFGGQLLVNRSVTVNADGCRISFGGLHECRYHKQQPEKLYTDEADIRICMSHYPVMPAFLPDRKPDVLLCGHTHGGQFNALGFTPYCVGFERFGANKVDTMFVAGLRELGGMRVLISKGIGTSKIPLRIGVRPEIHRIVFG